MNTWERLKTLVEAAGDWSADVPKNAREVISKLSDEEMKTLMSAMFSFRDDNAVIRSERNAMIRILDKMREQEPSGQDKHSDSARYPDIAKW